MTLAKAKQDRAWAGRTITLPKTTAEALDVYRKTIEEELGVPIPYHLAIALAVKRAMDKK